MSPGKPESRQAGWEPRGGEPEEGRKLRSG